MRVHTPWLWLVLAPMLGGWEVERSAPGSWPPTARVHVRGEAPFHAWPDRSEVPRLVISCERGKLSAYVETSFPAEIYGNNYDTWLALGRVAFDGEVPEDAGFRRDIATGQLHFRRTRRFVRELLQHESLLFEFTPTNSSPTQTTFDLRGLSEHVSALEERCHL